MRLRAHSSRAWVRAFSQKTQRWARWPGAWLRPTLSLPARCASAKSRRRPGRGQSGTPSPRLARRARAAAGLNEIARTGDRVDLLLASIDACNSTKRPALATDYATPRNAWEKKLAAIWRDVLRLDRVGIYDNFFELGGDSLRAAEAFARMWDMGVPDSISIQTMESPTIADLARAIEEVKQGYRPSLVTDRFSLADEGSLAEDIRLPGNDVHAFDRPMSHVLLTGGTGYLGAYLMHELLVQTEAEIICLVRAATPEEGHQRITANLRRYGLYGPGTEARIDIVLGDLTEPRFGLSEVDFTALANRIDTIFHAAAWVNFVYRYHSPQEDQRRFDRDSAAARDGFGALTDPGPFHLDPGCHHVAGLRPHQADPGERCADACRRPAERLRAVEIRQRQYGMDGLQRAGHSLQHLSAGYGVGAVERGLSQAGRVFCRSSSRAAFSSAAFRRATPCGRSRRSISSPSRSCISPAIQRT